MFVVEGDSMESEGEVHRSGLYRPGFTEVDIGREAETHKGRGPEWLTPGGFDSHPRIIDMDTMGIDAVVLYPTVFAMLGGVREPDVALALARAYNNVSRGI